MAEQMTKAEKIRDDRCNFGWRVFLGLVGAAAVFGTFMVQGFLEYPTGRYLVVVGCILGYWVGSRGAIRRAISAIILAAMVLGVLVLVLVYLYRWVFGEFPALPLGPAGVGFALVAVLWGLYVRNERRV